VKQQKERERVPLTFLPGSKLIFENPGHAIGYTGGFCLLN
jgi:hypothetical protein